MISVSKLFQSFSISARVMVSTASVVGILLLWIIFFSVERQEKTIMAQNERTMTMMVTNVISALHTIMKAGYANIAHDFVTDIRKDKNIIDFKILRINGQEAFLDNKTVNDVNRRLGNEEFSSRDSEEIRQVLDPKNSDLLWVNENLRLLPRYIEGEGGRDLLIYLAPIINDEKCFRCHGRDYRLRGVVQLTTSLTQAELDIAQTRYQALIMAAAAVLFMLLLLYLMIRYSLVRPLGNVRDAMEMVAGGRLDMMIKVPGRDEISEIAKSFNTMIFQLRETYDGLHQEQDKLSTIILGALDGIVVTDGAQRVVLANPSAERMLGKDLKKIIDGGWENLIDDPEYMNAVLNRRGQEIPELVFYNNRAIKVHGATLLDEIKRPLGSAFMFRDVTEEKKLEDKLRLHAITDGLTQLYNRRFVDESLVKEIKRSQRYNHFFGFILFDVDHFKKFNDTHGHDQGDRVLQALARVMKEHFRIVDFPCRFGGEEFCVLLPDTDVTGVYIVAERFRRRVEQMEVDSLKVTVSIGIVAMPACEVNSPDELIKKADDALYEAKHKGRNQVCSATPVADGELPLDLR
ncbi:MAG: diguanylate cyclase [Nitrospirae bacterium]|nr:diguanylate cyclase [Magnetococcales bacterium]HAT51585.1 sensor domain-containing diguanylate cyclase [Alphaproteobacteria bacterium]